MLKVCSMDFAFQHIGEGKGERGGERKGERYVVKS